MSFRSALFAMKTSTVRVGPGRFHRELLSHENLTPAELDLLQNELACAIIRTAMRNSPYYRSTYGALGIDPADLDDPEAWAKLPILDRATVKRRSSEFPTPDAAGRNVRPALTGGSTGEPLRTMHDARVPTLALSWRMYSWWGVQPSDDLARIGRWNFGRRASLQNTVTWWPTRQIYLDASEIAAESMAAFHGSLSRIRPRLLEGYVGALLEFAEFLESRGLRIPAPLAVASTTAPLTASARLRLETVLGAPVYDEYRASEFGWLAGECARRDGLHIFSDARRVEVVDENGDPAAQGELGDLVITDLRNRVFPLIRYRTGAGSSGQNSAPAAARCR